ncbi:MAG: putative secreted protein [Chlamydiales bacterium]|jgi:hypothetical protein|nr:putative secreted protein [Chlamydiales bacterium]
MLRKALVFFLFLFLPQISEGALPPLYQTIREYQSLIDHPELMERLPSGEAIVSIERRDSSFLILTPRYLLQVGIVYQRQKMPGPGQFELTFHALKER